MSARPFVAPHLDSPAHWRKRIEEVANLWKGEWGVACRTSVTCSQPLEAPKGLADRVWSTSAGPRLCLRVETGLHTAVERCLFAPEKFVDPLDKQADHRLVHSVTDRACESLIADIVAALGIAGVAVQHESTRLPPELLRKGSGALAVCVLINGKTLWFLAADAARLPTSAMPPRRPACRPLRDALGPQPVGVRVEVGGADVPIGVLRSLGVGDVIRLGTPLDEPVRVFAADGRDIGSAYLCTVDGRRAAELVRDTIGRRSS